MPVVDYIHLVPCACGTLPQGYSVKLVPKQKPDAPVDSAVSQGFETAGVVLVFGLIVRWAWRPANRSRFESDSRIPLNDEG